MSNMAKDSQGNTVYADTIALSRKNEMFYCPNESCGVPMKLISPSVKEQRMTSSHFANRDRINKHIEGCFYSSRRLANAMKYDIENFNIGTLFQSVTKKAALKSGSSGENRYDTDASHESNRKLELKSVANTYYRFLVSDLDRVLNGNRIGSMFGCTRNHAEYTYAAKGLVLMELKYKNCYWGMRGEENHLTMYCLFPRTKGEYDEPKIRWQLKFTSQGVLDETEYQIHRSLHEAFCKKYSESKKAGKDVILAVLGEWEGRSCRIYSAKQISVVRPGSNI